MDVVEPERAVCNRSLGFRMFPLVSLKAAPNLDCVLEQKVFHDVIFVFLISCLYKAFSFLYCIAVAGEGDNWCLLRRARTLLRWDRRAGDHQVKDGEWETFFFLKQESAILLIFVVKLFTQMSRLLGVVELIREVMEGWIWLFRILLNFLKEAYFVLYLVFIVFVRFKDRVNWIYLWSLSVLVSFRTVQLVSKYRMDGLIRVRSGFPCLIWLFAVS